MVCLELDDGEASVAAVGLHPADRRWGAETCRSPSRVSRSCKVQSDWINYVLSSFNVRITFGINKTEILWIKKPLEKCQGFKIMSNKNSSHVPLVLLNDFKLKVTLKRRF